MAVEFALLAIFVALPLWYLFRSEPAIAFAQRDWVVVGNLKNLTDETTFDDSLEAAFRIGLEQSRYVNVLSDLRTRNTVRLMRRDPEHTDIDRTVGSEVAIRDGARALILPTIAEIGGRVRVTAEVVDPQTQTTVWSESADGIGAESVLPSLDAVNQKLRLRLGEALATVSSESQPLDKVATKNLDCAARVLARRTRLSGGKALRQHGALQAGIEARSRLRARAHRPCTRARDFRRQARGRGRAREDESIARPALAARCAVRRSVGRRACRARTRRRSRNGRCCRASIRISSRHTVSTRISRGSSPIATTMTSSNRRSARLPPAQSVMRPRACCCSARCMSRTSATDDASEQFAQARKGGMSWHVDYVFAGCSAPPLRLRRRVAREDGNLRCSLA